MGMVGIQFWFTVKAKQASYNRAMSNKNRTRYLSYFFPSIISFFLFSIVRELSGKRYKTLPPVSSHTNAKLNSSEKTRQDLNSASASKSGSDLASRESLGDQNINHLNLFSPGKTTVLQVTFGKKGEIYVQPSTGAQSRSPTMSECKDIIHYLEDTNKRQGQEVSKLSCSKLVQSNLRPLQGALK